MRRRARSGWLLGLLTSASLSLPTGVPAGEEPRTLFLDDFSGDTLDRARWNVEISGDVYNNEQQAYVDAPEVVSIVRGDAAEGADGGALRLSARKRAGYMTPQGRQFDFVSARLNTRGKFEFARGTAAARMKLAAGSGIWPAFWILGTGRWPDTGEIDIMENVGERGWTSVALHGPGYSGETPLTHREPFPPGQDATGWHVYSVDWSDEGFVFRVDGREIERITRPMVERHGRWVFDEPKFLILNLALGGGYPQGVNQVKQPYPGLPTDSVRKIETGEARVLVDWIKVTAG